ncbi:uncharacterized protein EV154DRAFT_478820 [Mucor mucedo]|uniref:uncharacterized protein n=1 Tax=Mucor mucedo TaxID=29922 RepID=UPI00221E95E1|nr:uncharacterized protein EV154DRAFT_478820 [Mucor mucedo]KAI7894027.1 hypothetical protein EV154DRAFT_478820 [Mucor mucedo]
MWNQVNIKHQQNFHRLRQEALYASYTFQKYSGRTISDECNKKLAFIDPVIAMLQNAKKEQKFGKHIQTKLKKNIANFMGTRYIEKTYILEALNELRNCKERSREEILQIESDLYSRRGPYQPLYIATLVITAGVALSLFLFIINIMANKTDIAKAGFVLSSMAVCITIYKDSKVDELMDVIDGLEKTVYMINSFETSYVTHCSIVDAIETSAKSLVTLVENCNKYNQYDDLGSVEIEHLKFAMIDFTLCQANIIKDSNEKFMLEAERMVSTLRKDISESYVGLIRD